MSGSLSVGPAELRALAARQRGIAERAIALTAELKSAIERAGGAWGTDKSGKAFEEYYLPGSEQSIEALDHMVTVLDALGTGLADSADAFESDDIDLGEFITRGGPRAVEAARSGFYGGELGGPAPERSAQGTARAAEPLHRIPDVQASEGWIPERQQYGQEASPGAFGTATGPMSGDHGVRETPPSRIPAREGFPQVSSPANATPSASSSPRETPGTRARSEVTPARGTGETRAPNRPGATTLGPPRDSVGYGRAATTPWSGSTPSGTGVSGPSGPHASRGPVTAPPPRPSAPRKGSPPKTAQAAEPPWQRPVKRSAVESVPHPDVRTDPEVLRIAGEMAARHGLTLIGFDSAGIDERAVRELSEALDDVLTTHHVLDLRVVEIAAHNDGVSAGTRWDPVGGGDGPATRAARLVLARAGLTAPHGESARDPAAEAGHRAPRPAGGPIYLAVVRELGRALDALGGHGAHRQIQRVLIGYFLGTVDPDHRRHSLGRVTSDYRRWRATLSGTGPDGRFDPASVLSAAFVEVVRAAGDAEEVSVVLHRLLLDAASGGG